MARRARGSTLTRTRQRRGGSASVEGFAELYAALKELPRATSTSVLKRSAKKALQPTLELAQSYAPVKTGKLRSGIRLTVGIDDPGFRKRARASFVAKGNAKGVKRTKGGGHVLAQIRAGGSAAPHASLIELGTVRVSAHPFLRPAFDGTQRQIVDSIRATVKVEIGKATKRRARKLAKLSAGG